MKVITIILIILSNPRTTASGRKVSDGEKDKVSAMPKGSALPLIEPKYLTYYTIGQNHLGQMF